ncbi:MAG TPA: hypothetical protein VJU80_02730 [Solirubrobacteraceae bacterium]|nr:hypothetical protein [Solirubrobacteraceae bacterium]
MEMPSEHPRDEATDMESRMDAIRLKQILGAALTDQELMCLQIEANGFGCQSCPRPPSGSPAED